MTQSVSKTSDQLKIVVEMVQDTVNHIIPVRDESSTSHTFTKTMDELEGIQTRGLFLN